MTEKLKNLKVSQKNPNVMIVGGKLVINTKTSVVIDNRPFLTIAKDVMNKQKVLLQKLYEYGLGK